MKRNATLELAATDAFADHEEAAAGARSLTNAQGADSVNPLRRAPQWR